jgi:YgiT-type zinc finger domain-containing protein
MNCTICKTGETSDGMTTVTLERGESTIIVKNVPAEVCRNCGEYYLTAPVAERVMELAEQAIRDGAEIGVIRFAA